MKKEKSLNFPCSKFFVVMFIAFGMTLFTSTTAVAQASPVSDAILAMTQTRDSFVPGTAKYDFAQAALDYLNVLEMNFNADPNYFDNLLDQNGGVDPLMATPMRKAHKSILAEYNAAQLAAFGSYVTEFNSGVVTDTEGAQKRQWILDANAY